MTIERKNKSWLMAVGEIDHCVLCHSNHMLQVAHRNYGRGKSQKSPDYQTARLCQECHHAIDNGHKLEKMERRWLMDKAIVETYSILLNDGKLLLNE